jgi:hypothetical protein
MLAGKGRDSARLPDTIIVSYGGLHFLAFSYKLGFFFQFA